MPADQPWTAAADLVALDLEGTGSQDGDDEAILEIAVVPLAAGRPDMGAAWDSTINPERWVSPRPWISRDLSGGALAGSPTLDKVADTIAEKLTGKIVIGHNIGVDWRLLRLRLPAVQPAGLLDTARLVRHLRPEIQRWNLAALLDQHALTGRVNELVPGGRPHRALWDAVGAALLLAELVGHLPGGPATPLATLTRLARVQLADPDREPDGDQLTLDYEPPS
ncbi:3'-5' exonuclease [Nonomuraea wenchangensis]